MERSATTWKLELRSGQRWDTRNYVFCPFLNKYPFNPLKPPFSFSLLSQKVTFDAGPQLQFLFHSDSSNNEWGYKFTVTALGLPDITVSWMSDLQLLVARLMGRLASRTLALKSPHGETVVPIPFYQKSHSLWLELLRVCCCGQILFTLQWRSNIADICLLLSTLEIRTVKELPPGKMSHVQSSPLWKPILRHGLCETRESNVTKATSDQVWSNLLNPVIPFSPPTWFQASVQLFKLVPFPLFRQMHGASMS